MKIFKENDVIQINRTIEAQVIGEERSLPVVNGAIGTVLLIYGEANNPVAYEVEFFIKNQDCYVLATVEASLLSEVSQA